MKLSLRQVLLLIAFMILYGVAVFAATRAYYSDSGRVATPASSTQTSGLDGAPVSTPLSNDPRTLNEQADNYLTNRDYPNAIAAFRKLVSIAPDSAEGYNDLGLSLHYGGRSGEALVVLQKGLMVDANNQRVWLTRGFVEYQLGELEAAKQSLTRAVELGADNEIAAEAQRFLERLP